MNLFCDLQRQAKLQKEKAELARWVAVQQEMLRAKSLEELVSTTHRFFILAPF